jgi:fructose-specific PTS system IIA-like component
MLFLDREAPPGEDEQYAVYRQAALSARGRTVIIRTLDVGGDKRLPFLRLPVEDNPFLGVRAVRFYANHEELVRTQLRAILRAAANGRCGPLKVMVPMVTGVDEVALVRRLLAEAAAELRRRRVPHARRLELGIMVETPAAALAIDLLAPAADFFSIGSNDLLQYVLAVDRGNAALACLYDPLHPAFLRLLQHAALQARKAKRWLGICGEMAGNREYQPLLVGLGFDELSMVPAMIPVARERLAQLDSGECRALLRRALRCADAAGVAALLREFNGRGSNGSPRVIAAQLVRLDSASRTPGEAIKELCDMLELDNRIADASVLEEAVWKREETFATDLGLGFALPHARSSAVRVASIAFLRPARPMRWSVPGKPVVRGILLIVVPEKGGEEHLRLIARLSRQLMHEDFRAALLKARAKPAVLAALEGCLRSH